MADAFDLFSAIHDSPVVLALSELGGAVPSPLVCPICADVGGLPVILRPELYINVATS
jgi:hypothetical protein